jgi:hypothetical protein
MLVSSAHDKQVAPDRVRELYADLGSREKLFVDLACSSQNAAWEKNQLLLFRASLVAYAGAARLSYNRTAAQSVQLRLQSIAKIEFHVGAAEFNGLDLDGISLLGTLHRRVLVFLRGVLDLHRNRK